MVLANHNIHFLITQTCSLFNDWWSFNNKYMPSNDASVIFPIASISMPKAMFQKGYRVFKSFQLVPVTLFTCPNLTVNPFMANKAFFSYFSLCIDIFRIPLFMAEHVRNIQFHAMVKFFHFCFLSVMFFCPMLRSRRFIHATLASAFTYISSQLPRYCWRRNANLLSYKLLFYTGITKGFIMVSFYQTELSVIFCQRNANI